MFFLQVFGKHFYVDVTAGKEFAKKSCKDYFLVSN